MDHFDQRAMFLERALDRFTHMMEHKKDGDEIDPLEEMNYHLVSLQYFMAAMIFGQLEFEKDFGEFRIYFDEGEEDVT